jgi:hypothetical protein
MVDVKETKVPSQHTANDDHDGVAGEDDFSFPPDRVGEEDEVGAMLARAMADYCRRRIGTWDDKFRFQAEDAGVKVFHRQDPVIWFGWPIEPMPRTWIYFHVNGMFQRIYDTDFDDTLRIELHLYNRRHHYGLCWAGEVLALPNAAAAAKRRRSRRLRRRR